jgi:GH15 family glucan-1,4-alpha-glucosidase
MKIEDYGLIGDTQTAALVGLNGSIDWLCLPRFDSGACFAALLGDDRNGFWRIAPTEAIVTTTRRYRPGTLILETDFATANGAIRLTDFMPIRQQHPFVMRLVTGLRGKVAVKSKLVVRFDYGAMRPWVTKTDHSLEARAGPDAVLLRTTVPTHGEGFSSVAEFTLTEGQSVPFALHWYPSHQEPPPSRGVDDALADTESWWTDFARTNTYRGKYSQAVQTSVLALKAMTYAPTGGIVASVTTSLPEALGGSRNWDYRFCWLRDAAFTLEALLSAGYREEAAAWRNWLLRAVGGDPATVQALYGPAGERRLTEVELPYLAGYENSKPVRVGNAAFTQCQIDIYGEIVNALFRARADDGVSRENELDAWSLQQKLVEFLVEHWQDDDNGIWEVRGALRPYTYSKVMAWVAFDRTVQMAEKYHLPCDADRWRAVRGEIKEQILTKGYNPALGTFTQSYGSEIIDAAVLRIPLVGFLPASDPRMISTIAAVEKSLCHDGFVARYSPGSDRLAGSEGVFLPCSFWLVENYALTGRISEATQLFERLLTLCSPLGLLSEEYSVKDRRLLGNYPQAFSHIALINAAVTLAETAARQPAA